MPVSHTAPTRRRAMTPGHREPATRRIGGGLGIQRRAGSEHRRLYDMQLLERRWIDGDTRQGATPCFAALLRGPRIDTQRTTPQQLMQARSDALRVPASRRQHAIHFCQHQPLLGAATLLAPPPPETQADRRDDQHRQCPPARCRRPRRRRRRKMDVAQQRSLGLHSSRCVHRRTPGASKDMTASRGSAAVSMVA